MSKLAKALTAAAGNAGAGALYVEDVFSTYLWAGNSTAGRVIVNDIDVSGEGGLVWIKDRTLGDSHSLFTTTQGANKTLLTNTTDAEDTVGTDVFQSFNSNGFTVGSHGRTNENNRDYASWTFRKAEKFFDVVTYTGNGASSHLISHNLGATPAFMVMKRIDNTSGWMTAASDGAGNYKAAFNLNSTAQSYVTTPISTVSTDSTVDVGYWNPNWDGAANLSGATYVLYLFASDAGGFGDDGSENIIKCGSYTGNGSVDGTEVDCGFEPQFLLLKAASTVGNWLIYDNMRGFVTGGTDSYLQPNTSNAEGLFESGEFLPNGFKLKTTDSVLNGSGSTYIYIAIRRPMKTPESGTEVFSPSTYAGNDPTPTVITTGFPVDLALTAYRDLANAGAFGFTPRLTEAYMYSATTAAEVATGLAFDSNTSFATDANHWNQSPSNLIGYGFKRATGFFDVVAYTGDKVLGRTVNHNLGVAPELIIIKRRTGQADQWSVGHTDLGWLTRINIDNANAAQSSNNVYWNSTAPTSTQFTIGSLGSMNETGASFISYLFATLAGVSKVGSYTGTGADLNVDCGFSAGARFIFIKRTDSSGNWYVWDSARGITAGNDPYLLFNSTGAEVTSNDYIDPLSSGFTVTSSAPPSLNASGGTYIFLAIA